MPITHKVDKEQGGNKAGNENEINYEESKRRDVTNEKDINLGQNPERGEESLNYSAFHFFTLLPLNFEEQTNICLSS